MRPHIPHLDADALAWEEILDTGATRKVLGRDPETGSDTSFVRLPPGWQGPTGAHYHSSFEEALVLCGDVDLNGNDLLVGGSYLYRPGGIVHGWVDRSSGGSEIIIKMGAETDLIAVGAPEHDHEYEYPPARAADGRPHIVHLRTGEKPWEPWTGGTHGVHGKVLSRDRDSGAETLMMRIDEGFDGGVPLSADETWEWVVVEGGLSLADGATFGRIGYSHRPAGHGETVIAAAPLGCTLLMWREGPNARHA